MDITVFDDFPEIDFIGSKYIQINNTDFVELKPVMDMCRIHNKTLLISFSEKEE